VLGRGDAGMVEAGVVHAGMVHAEGDIFVDLFHNSRRFTTHHST